MFYIAFLTLLGILFLIAELVFLPGVTIGALLTIGCYGSSIYLAFRDYGTTTGTIVSVVIFVLSLLVTIFALRTKTWQRFSLKQEIDSSSSQLPSEILKIGECGTTVSRLAPMGKISVNGRIWEAKSLDRFIDQQCDVEIVDFENFSVIVRKIN